VKKNKINDFVLTLIFLTPSFFLGLFFCFAKKAEPHKYINIKGGGFFSPKGKKRKKRRSKGGGKG
jgi:hypothetical protein